MRLADALVFVLFQFFKAASNVGPYGLFWQPALVRYYHRYYMHVYVY